MEQPSIPTLHHLQSSQSMRVLWALEEVVEANLYKEPFKFNLVLYKREVGQPELNKVFPVGKSPILIIEEKGGAPPKPYQLDEYPGILTESILLLDFVNTEYANNMWTPTSEDDKRRAKFFDVLAHNTLSVKNISALLFEVIPSMMPFGIRHLGLLMVSPIVSYWKRDMQPVFQLMEDALSEQKPWFGGEKMALADFDMSWCMDMSSARGYFDEKKFPKLKVWLDQVHARPAYKRALERGGGYDLVRFTNMK